MESKQVVRLAVASLDKHKAEDLRVLQVDDLTIITDYFIIATGSSSTMVKSLADYLEHDLAGQGVKPLSVEGYRSTGWILVDYGCVIVHIFMEDARKFYDLERLWKDGRELPTAEFIAP